MRRIRLLLSVLLGSFCLVALCAALRGGTRAASLGGTGLVGPPAAAADSVATDDAQPFTVAMTVHLPLAVRKYRPFVNGDFGDGLMGWEAVRGPFGGHGSGLPQGVVDFDGGQRALLGDPDAADNYIPVGYGTLSQTFTLNKRYLRLQYWVFSYDIARGDERYYDTFEVSINRPPADISDVERDNRDCDTAAGLNPQGTVTVSGDGLAFCGGRPGTTGVGTPWDTGGWKTVALDLGAFKNVTLYLTIWSREDDPEFRDDHGWFNTWAYVDNVQPANSP